MSFRDPRAIYNSIYKRFLVLSQQILNIIIQTTSNCEVRAILQEYGIQLQEVISNMNQYIQIINHYFTGTRPKSLDAVEAVIQTLHKKVCQYQQFSTIKKASFILSLQVFLKNVIVIIDSVWTYEDDIAAFPNFNNSKYQEVYQRITVVNDPHPQRSRQQSDTLRLLMNITNSAVITELSQGNSFFGLLAFGLSFPRFAICSETAQLKSTVFIRSPRIDVLSQIWNLPEKGAIGVLKYVQFEYISTNRMIYIPRRGNSPSVLQESRDSIPVRLLYNGDIHFQGERSGCCSNNNPRQLSTILIHFHGGGFVSLSSSTTQSYTRRWAKGLNIPVLSVDYAMPPENRFPVAVEDSLTAYSFIVTQLAGLCNINPKRIILAGDSAGGNLVCSLMGLILKQRLPAPVGIFLAYPACSLKMTYSPSRLHSFFTPILHPSLLYLCLREYLGPDYPHLQHHPLASPLYLTNQFVGEREGDLRFPTRWPKTHIIVGDADPLLDDSLRLCERMVQSGVDVRCRIYKNLSHGFLSLQKVLNRGQEAIVNSIGIMMDWVR